MRMFNYDLGLVTRTFQPKATINTFNETRFVDTFALPLKKLLTTELFKKVVVVINTEKNNQYAEIENNEGISPSEFYINKYFKNDIANGELIILKSTKWGQNAGSAQALTQGAKEINRYDIKYVMNWSAEMDIGKYDIVHAMESIKNGSHDVVGFLREKWWLKFQWGISQNTASIWNVKALEKVGYFDEFCDNNTKTMQSEEFGEIPLLGMEDFFTMLKMMKNNQFFTWAMVKNNDPIIWNTQKNISEERDFINRRKIHRQESVIRFYIETIKETKEHEAVLEHFFSKRKIYE